MKNYDLVIVGGGPAGLAAAISAKDNGIDSILIIERDKELGGILNPSSLSIEDRNALIKKNPAYGNIICRCEMITEGEIIDSIRRPLGARSLDGIKRRTRAGMGRCQAGFCSPRTMEILEREVPMSMYDITKSGGDSTFIVGRNKEL